MDTNKILTLSVVGVLALATSLTITQIFLRKIKSVSEADGKIKSAYAILFLTWMSGFTMLNSKIMTILSEYIDAISKTNPPNPLPEIAKTASIFIGMGSVWLIILHFSTKVFSTLFAGKRNTLIEVENNHFAYFLMRGLIFLGFAYILLPVFEILLRSFLPTFDFPFYR
jgi:hypothetical protein